MSGSAWYLAPAAIEHLWLVARRVMVLMRLDQTTACLDENPVRINEIRITHVRELRAVARTLGGSVEWWADISSRSAVHGRALSSLGMRRSSVTSSQSTGAPFRMLARGRTLWSSFASSESSLWR